MGLYPVLTWAVTSSPVGSASAGSELPESGAAMVVVTVGLTALAGPLYGIAERAAGDLRDRGPYISAVFGGGEDAP